MSTEPNSSIRFDQEDTLDAAPNVFAVSGTTLMIYQEIPDTGIEAITTLGAGRILTVFESRHIRTVAESAFEAKRRKIRPNTFAAYWQYILHPERGWVTWHLERFPGATAIEEIDTRHIQAFIDHLTLTLEPRTVRLAYQAIRSVVFKYAIAMKLTTFNAATDIDLPNISKKRMPRPELHEFLRIMASIESDSFYGKRDAAIFVLLGLLGLRRSEVLALKLTDYKGDRVVLSWRAKGGLTQELPVNANAKIVLDRYVEERANFGTVLGDALIISGQYSGDAHGALSPHRLWKIVKDRASAAGVKTLTPHALRRMFGTEIYHRTHDIYAAKELLGHSSVQVTIDHYAEPSMTMMRDAVNLLDVNNAA